MSADRDPRPVVRFVLAVAAIIGAGMAVDLVTGGYGATPVSIVVAVVLVAGVYLAFIRGR